RAACAHRHELPVVTAAHTDWASLALVVETPTSPLPQRERARFTGAESSDAAVLTRPAQPHLVVMERRAAIWRDRVGASERVDAAAVGVGGIGPDRFRDQHAAAHAVEQFGV